MATPLVSRFRLESLGGGFRIAPLPGSDTTLLYRLRTPADCATPRYGILQMLVGELMMEAHRLGLELQPKGLLDDPLLVLTEAEIQLAVPGVRYPFAELSGRYAAHWGLTDFYPEHAQALRAALASGEALDTGRFGAKKEIQFARIRREVVGGELQIVVWVEADDGLAQADTAVWKAYGGNDAASCGREALAKLGLSRREAVTELEALAAQAGMGEVVEHRQQTTLPPAATFEQVTACLEQLVDTGEAELEAQTERLTALARERIAILKGRTA